MAARSGGGAGQVRLIGGRWRRHRLAVARVSGLRPTPDRVRETLFNWLEPCIDGARCLDLFAGTGALGLEAASRGASTVTLVESDPRAAAAIREAAGRLGAAGASVVEADALAWLGRAGEPYDVVFVDPPFDSGLHAEACRRLGAGGWLARGAVVYVEAGPAGNPLPDGWTVLRCKKAGRVRYHLAAPDAAAAGKW